MEREGDMEFPPVAFLRRGFVDTVTTVYYTLYLVVCISMCVSGGCVFVIVMITVG